MLKYFIFHKFRYINKKVVNKRLGKLFASPLDAPARPIIKQAKTRMRLTPNRSAIRPDMKTIIKPDAKDKLHIQPT